MKIHTKNSESAIVVVATLRQGGQAELKILDGPGQRISFGTGIVELSFKTQNLLDLVRKLMLE